MKRIRPYFILFIILAMMTSMGFISASSDNSLVFTSDTGFKPDIASDGDYAICEIRDVDFKIPLEYLNNSKIKNDTFYLTVESEDISFNLEEEEYLIDFYYGCDIYSANTKYITNKTIASHPSVIIYMESSLFSELDIYFQSANRTFKISSRSVDMESALEKIIKDSPESSMGEEEFYKTLDRYGNDYAKDNNLSFGDIKDKYVSPDLLLKNVKVIKNTIEESDEEFDYMGAYYDGYYDLAPRWEDDEEYMNAYWDGYYDNYENNYPSSESKDRDSSSDMFDEKTTREYLRELGLRF